MGSVTATSDAQIAKQVALLSTADNYATWRADADSIIQEGHNRLDGLGETMKSFRDQSAGTGAGPAAPTGKTVVRTGTANGRKVAQYSDGTTGYVD
jgi:hypothetical protein